MPENYRLFISISVPEELKQRIFQLQKEFESDGLKLVEPENLHITLKFLGDVEEKKLSEIISILSSLSFEKFPIHMKGIGVFPNENYMRVVWIGCESNELNMLGNKINEILAKYFRKEQFSGHLTIIRVKRKVDIHQLLQKHKSDDFGSFTCDKFELKRSQLGREGPKYSTVEAFACR